jgi:hypothetical protein
MTSPVRSWIAVGLLACVGNAAIRPAFAQAAADDDANEPSTNAPTATPAAGAGAPPAPPYPAAPYGGYPPPGYAPPGYAPPGYAPYPGYPPPQVAMVHRPRRGLVTAGAITFGVSWGVAASISFVLSTSTCGSTSCSDSADYLWIPIAGPLFVASNDSEDAPGIFYLWSAAQAAGVLMFIIGLIGHDVPEYRIARRGPTLQLAPLFARDANGMALTARW